MNLNWTITVQMDFELRIATRNGLKLLCHLLRYRHRYTLNEIQVSFKLTFLNVSGRLKND